MYLRGRNNESKMYFLQWVAMKGRVQAGTQDARTCGACAGGPRAVRTGTQILQRLTCTWGCAGASGVGPGKGPRHLWTCFVGQGMQSLAQSSLVPNNTGLLIS